jgi:hypothetical protein
MQTAEFNPDDFSNTAEADKSLLVKFFPKTVPDQAETAKNGRPCFKDKTYIEIRIAGQRDAQACRPVTHADKQRFPAHFKAYEDRVAPPTEGMPLTEWAQVSRTQVEELTFLNVKTVEQLASISDSNIAGYMGGYTLRDKAKKYLETAGADKIDLEKEEMRDEIAELKAMVKSLMAVPVNAQALNEPMKAETEINVLDVSGMLDAPEVDKLAPKPRAARAKRTK